MLKSGNKQYYEIAEVAHRLNLTPTRIRQIAAKILKEDLHYRKHMTLFTPFAVELMKERNRKGGRPKKK